MNCQNHPETPATAYCRNCGKPVCDACRRDAFGTVYCAEHIPAPPPPPAPGPAVTPPQPVFAAAPNYVRPDVSPGLALFLGTIPGVAAIYNGQYAKGLVHAIIWGMLMSIANSRAANGLEPVFVMLVIAWWAGWFVFGVLISDTPPPPAGRGGGSFFFFCGYSGGGLTWPSSPITPRAS